MSDFVTWRDPNGVFVNLGGIVTFTYGEAGSGLTLIGTSTVPLGAILDESMRVVNSHLFQSDNYLLQLDGNVIRIYGAMGLVAKGVLHGPRSLITTVFGPTKG